MALETNVTLLVVVGLLVLVSIIMQYLLLRNGNNLEVNDIVQALNIPSLAEMKTTLDIPNTDSIEVALSASLQKQGIAGTIGEFSSASTELRSVANQLNQNMMKKSTRAAWGEWILEENLKEVFNDVKIRESVNEIGGKIPDAHIRVDGKILCIDSKFVYDNYEKYMQTPESQVKNRESHLETFRKDVKKHVEKIRTDYVQPGRGTYEIAFMFVPSNSVYDFIITDCDEVMRSAAGQGVIICSPNTLMANMYMLRMVRLATNMSKMHNEILDAHLRVANEFERLEADWKVLSSHANNLSGKIAPVASKITNLGGEIKSLEQLGRAFSQSSTTPALLPSSVDTEKQNNDSSSLNEESGITPSDGNISLEAETERTAKNEQESTLGTRIHREEEE
jgi:DNA recombination protein RmuC